jgi:hypothetical protein
MRGKSVSLLAAGLLAPIVALAQGAQNRLHRRTSAAGRRPMQAPRAP